jgi:magnesium transporter
VSVVAAHLYRNGKKAKTVSLDEPIDCRGKSEFVWIGLFEPSERELEQLEKNYGLHPLAIEDAYKANQIPKVDVYGDTAIFAGENFIISVRHGSARAHSELRAQLEAAPGLLGQGPDYVLHAILDFIVDGYFPVVETIEERVLVMEQNALDSFLSRADVKRIFGLRQELIRFKRIIGPMTEVCGRLVHLDTPCLDANARPYFQDVLDHVRRVDAMVNSLRDVLTSVFEVSNLLEQQRQGVITRQLAAWAAILAVPTAIAGIYGMNFENMPELKTQYGYFVVVGIIALLCTVLYLRFKRARWL